MAYHNLRLDQATPPRVQRVMATLERLFFREVHVILRLPLPAAGLEPHCSFAATLSLLAAIAGISTTLYQGTGQVGTRFKGLLEAHYPWDHEPTHTIAPAEAADLIYEAFRNPLAHNLGFDLYGKAGGAKLVVKRLEGRVRGQGKSEEWIETLEAGPDRPHMGSTVIVRHDGARLLSVPALYWGVRRMVENLTRDAHLMQRAETFLAGRI